MIHLPASAESTSEYGQCFASRIYGQSIVIHTNVVVVVRAAAADAASADDAALGEISVGDAAAHFAARCEELYRKSPCCGQWS